MLRATKVVLLRILMAGLAPLAAMLWYTGRFALEDIRSPCRC